MTKETAELLNRIATNPQVLVGKPVIRGTRIPVSLILNLIANGASFEEILADYPVLSSDDIKAALLFAGASLDSDEIYLLAANS
jgi:uncharacterized protein (DUF433 family)